MNINNVAAKVCSDIEDIKVVTKHLGQEYVQDTHRNYLFMNQHKVVILQKAKDMEEECKARTCEC